MGEECLSRRGSGSGITRAANLRNNPFCAFCVLCGSPADSRSEALRAAMRLDTIVEHLSHRHRIGVVIHALVETSRRSAPHQAIPEGIGRGLARDGHARRLASGKEARIAGWRLRLDGALAPTRHARGAGTPRDTCTPCTPRDTCTPRGADTGTPCIGPRGPGASRESRGTTRVSPARSCRACVSRGTRRPATTRRASGLSGLRTRACHETQSHAAKQPQKSLHGSRA